jgi:enterochelin esterase-like enzyme
MKLNRLLGRIFALALAGLLATPAFALEETAPKGFDEPRDVPHGQVKPETYDSKTLGFERKMTVYLAAGLFHRSEISGALPVARLGR